VKADIDLTAAYPHPIDKVWAALTSAEALEAWLMPNDFRPVVGHRFTFRTRPAPGFDGIVRCEVLELDPPRRMAWSWSGGKIDTVVTFTLEQAGEQQAGEQQAGEQTRLRMHQVGFDGLGAQIIRRILASGWPGILRERLAAYLNGAAGLGTPPVPQEDAAGWRAYLPVFRGWRQTPSK
jgi:uncharacterized protein YndB with AHSA1/START domain